MSVFAATNHRNRPSPAGSISMTARLRPPHARTASPPRPVLRRSPCRSSWVSSHGSKPSAVERLALGHRGERPVSGRRRGGAEDAEIDAGGDVGLARVSAGRPRPRGGAGTRGRRHPPRVRFRSRSPAALVGSGPPRASSTNELAPVGQDPLAGPAIDSGAFGVDRARSASRPRRGCRPSTATRTSRGPSLGAADPPEGEVVQQLVGQHDARAVGGHAIEHGHAVDRAQDRPGPGAALDRDRADRQIVEASSI